MASSNMPALYLSKRDEAVRVGWIRGRELESLALDRSAMTAEEGRGVSSDPLPPPSLPKVYPRRGQLGPVNYRSLPETKNQNFSNLLTVGFEGRLSDEEENLSLSP